MVRIHSPLLADNYRPRGCLKTTSPAVCSFKAVRLRRKNLDRRPPSSSLPSLPKLIDGFLQYKAAEGLSSRTIDSDKRLLAQWTEHVGEIDAGKITSRDLIAYITYMRDEYIPRRITGNNEEKLSTKSIRNIYVGLSAFFHWLSDEFGWPNPIKGVPAPKFTSPEVDPYTKQEIKAMLKACDYKTDAETDRRKKFVMRRASANQDRGLILTLLDTGLHASELCSLRIGDMDVKTGKVTVRHGSRAGQKGARPGSYFWERPHGAQSGVI